MKRPARIIGALTLLALVIAVSELARLVERDRQRIARLELWRAELEKHVKLR